MLTFLCALIASSTWVIFASKFGWPVSTTHSIVGAVCGAGIAGLLPLNIVFGFNSVVWGWNGMGKIIASWFISPILAGIVASGVFLFTRTIVLNNKESLSRGLKVIPFYFTSTFAILIFFLINKVFIT